MTAPAETDLSGLINISAATFALTSVLALLWSVG
jgi:hypothetical protein